MDRPDEGRAERNPSACRELTLPFDSTFRYFDARAHAHAPFPSDFIVKVMHFIDLSPSPSLFIEPLSLNEKYFETRRSESRPITCPIRNNGSIPKIGARRRRRKVF